MFNKQKNGGQGQIASPRTALEGKARSGASTLIAVVAFTLVNCVFMLLGSDSYFLFSAMIPYFLVIEGMFLTGRLDPAVYGVPEEVLPDSALYILIVVALAMIAIYLICFILCKKHLLPALIAGLVCFGLDTLAMFGLFGVSVEFLIDYILHALVIIGLISGISAALKLKKLPPDDPAANAAAAVTGSEGTVFAPVAPIAGQPGEETHPASPEATETPSEPSDPDAQ